MTLDLTKLITAEDKAAAAIPARVAKAQAKIALFNADLLDAVEALVASYPYRPVSIWYSDADYWERHHPYLEALAIELGLTDEQVDVLFVAASLL